MRFSRVTHALGAGVLLVGLAGVTQSSSAVDWYPGIPPNDGTVVEAWTSLANNGIGYSKLAKQWFRNPAGMAISRSRTTTVESTPTLQHTKIHAQAYLVSPDGAPANYGYLEPVTVRSVGFGLIPVEATLQVSQQRKNGYPVPILADLDIENRSVEIAPNVVKPSEDVVAPVVVRDAFNVTITKVKMDGQDVGLLPGCRTVTPAPVHLVGPGYVVDTPENPSQWFATHDPKSYFNPFYGGYMAGTISIPPFTGCKTASGDDISALMTKSASGPGNPIETRAGWPCANPDLNKNGTYWPVAPGKNTPKKAGCEGVQVDPYPTTAPN